jgi:predicted  nucleic acid-binding Zn-ribbon protein
MSISDHEKEIQTMKESIKDVNNTVQKLQSKLTEAHTVRDRLLDKVKVLEETKRGNRKEFIYKI